MNESALYFGEWGNLPVDGDVRPFSMINPIHADTDRKNRKHHFVSVVYMEGFTDANGRVLVYRSEDPEHPHPTQPSAIGYENYYYSQKLHGGGQENHRFEDLWNSIESVWPETIRALETRRLSPTISFNVLGMQTIMYARVPAAHDRHALMLEVKLRSQVRVLEELGALPDELDRYAGQLDNIPIAINPHETLLAMGDDFKAFGDLCFCLGFEVLHNKTGTPFLTSDNPVCTYDPRHPLHTRIPHDHSGEIELIFPLTARMLVRGSTSLGPFNAVSRHRDVTDRRTVRSFNRTIAQFAYRMALSQDRSSDDIVCAHAGSVPTVATEVRRSSDEIQILWRHVFGPRPTLSQYIDTPEKSGAPRSEIGKSCQSAERRLISLRRRMGRAAVRSRPTLRKATSDASC
ncbi:DUF4238 domain-containing protein (plasmid) [Devosia sp. A8/3-2]|nr:DUF4238 domain-containing protein [Devosia sp. A8/3-2]